MARGAGGGDYLREASILKYFLQRGAIIRGSRLFEKRFYSRKYGIFNYDDNDDDDDDDDYVRDDQDSDGGKREEFNYQGLLKSLPLEFVQYL